MIGNRGLPLTAHGNVENAQVFAPNYELFTKGALLALILREAFTPK